MIRVLLVEDDENIACIIRGYLAREGGYDVCWAPDSERALDTACGGQDIILLDVMLPGMNGIELCRKLRQWYQCPILFISCLNDSGTIVQALESGGDDYLVKPFDNVILHAKIQATLRRVHMDRAVVPQTCSFRHFSFHAERQEIVKDGKPIRLLAMESHLLAYLIQHTGECFPASELYKAVWAAKRGETAAPCPCTSAPCGAKSRTIRRTPSISAVSGERDTASSRMKRPLPHLPDSGYRVHHHISDSVRTRLCAGSSRLPIVHEVRCRGFWRSS